MLVVHVLMSNVVNTAHIVVVRLGFGDCDHFRTPAAHGWTQHGCRYRSPDGQQHSKRQQPNAKGSQAELKVAIGKFEQRRIARARSLEPIRTVKVPTGARSSPKHRRGRNELLKG